MKWLQMLTMYIICEFRSIRITMLFFIFRSVLPVQTSEEIPHELRFIAQTMQKCLLQGWKTSQIFL